MYERSITDDLAQVLFTSLHPLTSRNFFGETKSLCLAEKRDLLRESRASRTTLPSLELYTWKGELQEKSKRRTTGCFPKGGGFLGLSLEL